MDFLIQKNPGHDCDHGYAHVHGCVHDYARDYGCDHDENGYDCDGRGSTFQGQLSVQMLIGADFFKAKAEPFVVQEA